MRPARAERAVASAAGLSHKVRQCKSLREAGWTCPCHIARTSAFDRSPPRRMNRIGSGPRLIVALAFIAFVSLGLPDGVLGVAWPSVRGTFGQPVSHLGVLLAAGTAGYLVSSFLGGQLVRVFGVGAL